MCSEQEVRKTFTSNLEVADDHSPAVATVQTLLDLLKQDKSTTVQEFSKNIRNVINHLKNIESSAEIESASEIFLRYISLRTTQFENFQEAKADLTDRGKHFLENVKKCKRKVADIAHQFITEGSKILVHSNSRVVFYTLLAARKSNKSFTVYVTQSCPNNTGELMCKWLKKEGIKCNLILDAAIGFYVDMVDLVLVGAEAVVKNGGIINKIGTYPMAVLAQAANKPFYVLVESYKFSGLYPLKQMDIPDCMKYKESNCNLQADGENKWSVADYTDPKYVTLLITDLGPLATAAVSDVLMQLYL